MSADPAISRRDVLQAMPGTVPKLAERSGWHRETVKRRLAELRGHGAHIGGWLIPEGRGPCAPIWHAGPGRSLPMPKRAKTNRQRHAIALAKHGRDLINAKSNAQHWRRKHLAGQSNPIQQAAFNLVKVKNEQSSI